MNVAELALRKLYELYAQQDGNLDVGYHVEKKLIIEDTRVNGNYLELAFTDGSRESVDVRDCNLNYDEGNVEIKGNMKDLDLCRHYTIYPVDYLECIDEHGSYIWN